MKRSPFGEKLALTAALFAGGHASEQSKPPQGEKEFYSEHHLSIEKTSFRDFILQTERKPIFQNPEFFEYHDGGNFSPEEILMRTQNIDGTGTLFHDVGLDFYVVQKGETLEEIKKKLSNTYLYLQHQPGRMNGFNILAKNIEPEMMLPVPLEKDERKISDQEFLAFAYEAIEEMLDDPEYGEFIKFLREKMSDEKIAISLLAIAKKESGGKPIGQFELHRYEPKYKVFSYSIFHVLNIGPGLVARQELGMTIGQTYHPENAVKLFFAFLIEKLLENKNREKENVLAKAKEKFLEFFELDEDFASFYNGKKWKTLNPGYLHEIHEYFGEAEHYFGENGILVVSLQKKPKTP